MKSILLGFAGLFAAAGVATGAYVAIPDSGEEELLQDLPTATAATAASPSSLAPTSAPAITPGPGVTLYRWVNLTVLIPHGSGISAGPNFAGARLGQTVGFSIVEVDPNDSRIASTVVLDSETGAITEEQVLDQHREEIDRVLATLSVGPFERSSAPWPYIGEPTPDLVRETEGGISWIRPSPSTGLYVGWGLADPGGFFIDLRNERSTAFASFNDAAGTLAFDTSAVAEGDLPVFERWLATVKQ